MTARAKFVIQCVAGAGVFLLAVYLQGPPWARGLCAIAGLGLVLEAGLPAEKERETR